MRFKEPVCPHCRAAATAYMRSYRKNGSNKKSPARTAPGLDTRPDGVVLPTVPTEGSQDPRWRERAACRGCDPDLFFPARRGDNIPPEVRAVCGACPVRKECLAEGMDERFGVWGGVSERGRRRLRATRPRRQVAIHGSITMYSTKGCRCPECRLFYSQYMKEKRRNAS